MNEEVRGEYVEGQMAFIQSQMREYEGVNEAEVEEIDISPHESPLGEPSQRETDDPYNLSISVAVIETETDVVDNEFSEAVVEIEGEKSFQCEQCDKVCKSKGGLTRHTNSKHGDGGRETNASGETATLDKDTVHGFVEAIKIRIIEEDIYGSATNTALATVSSTEALFDALLPLYETFRRKKNQDKLLESFYGLIPRSCELLKCKDYKIANLIMIKLPDILVGFFNTSNQNIANETQEETSACSPQLDPAEHGPLSYIAGYIVSKLHRTNRVKKGKCNEEIQALLQVMKSTDTINNFISARTRGGLISPCDDLVSILEVAELSFRREVNKTKETLRSIPTEYICNSVLDSPVVKSLWENIVLSSGIELSSPTQKLCLENVVKLYLKVRSFSYARDYITKYNIKVKQTKNKALRKDLKKASAEKLQLL